MRTRLNTWRSLAGAAVAGWACLCVAAPAPAQATQAPPPAVEPAPPAAGEVGRLFEAYALMQAQDTLGLGEEQYGRFIRRFRTLLDTRRRHAAARQQVIRELQQLTRGEAAPDEATLRARLEALDEQDARARTEIGLAQDGVDEVLTVPQRARFRVLEDQLERRRWELMARARQSSRPARRTPPR